MGGGGGLTILKVHFEDQLFPRITYRGLLSPTAKLGDFD